MRRKRALSLKFKNSQMSRRSCLIYYTYEERKSTRFALVSTTGFISCSNARHSVARAARRRRFYAMYCKSLLRESVNHQHHYISCEELFHDVQERVSETGRPSWLRGRRTALTRRTVASTYRTHSHFISSCIFVPVRTPPSPQKAILH